MPIENTNESRSPKIMPYLSKSVANIDGYKMYTFYIRGSDYLKLPLDANVRLPNEKSIPYKEMMDTLSKCPNNFVLYNNGINVIAEEVKIHENNNTIELIFPSGTGIVNGGHTQLALINSKSRFDISKAVIKIDVIEHNFRDTELAVIAASRNTATNVQPYSTAEKKGLNKKIKNCMSTNTEQYIIWYENEVVPNNHGILATDLIAYLNLFNVKEFQSQSNHKDTQPIKSATSKTAVYKEWVNKHESYEYIYPLTDDILELLEHIQSTFNVGSQRGFTGLDVIKNVKKKDIRTIIFNKKIDFILPTQFLLPLFASMRANVRYSEKENKIGWYENPEVIFDKSKKILTTDLLRTYKSTYHNEINRASKDTNLWRILYSDVVPKIGGKSKAWKMYDIPQ